MAVPNLDPEEWARIQDGDVGAGFVFRRALELSKTWCEPFARKGEWWLDAGTGTGHLAAALAGGGARVAGVDFSLAMSAYAKRRWPAARFVTGDVVTLPFSDGSLGGICAISLLGCLDGGQSFFSECARVLRSGGLLCVSATNRRSLPLALIGAARRIRAAPVVERYAAYDPRVVCADLERSGFTILRQRFYGRYGLPSRLTTSWERDVVPGARTAIATNVLFLAQR